MINTENLFNNIPSLVEGEDFSELLNCRNVVIERIVSSDQAKSATFSDRPDNKVYNQEQDEWVILIKGEAQLRINDDIVKLKAGDYLFIPAQTPHQVLVTSSNCLQQFSFWEKMVLSSLTLQENLFQNTSIFDKMIVV